MFMTSNYNVVRIKSYKINLILALFYVSPDCNFLIFFDNFNLLLSSLNERFPELSIVVGGDFNCRLAALNQLDPTMFTDLCNFTSQRYSKDVL